MPSRIGALAGRYVLTRLLGENAAGAIFEALDSAQDRTVLIKLLPKALAADPTRQEQLQRLVERLTALEHPNLLSIVEAGIQEGVPYLVAKEIAAAPLAEKMGQTLDPEQVAGIISQVGEALVHAYQEGLIHGSLSPQNVLIDAGGRVLLADVGLESVLKTPWETVQKELATYLAPEQLLGREPDARADVYALGVMLFEMLTGLRPDGRAAQALPWLQEILPGLAPDLEPVLARALSTDPRTRYTTVGEFMADVRPILARYLRPAEPSGPPEPAPRPVPAPSEVTELSIVPPPTLIAPALEGIPAIAMPEPPPMPTFDWEAFSQSLVRVPLPEPPLPSEPPPLPEPLLPPEPPPLPEPLLPPEPPPLPEITAEGIAFPVVPPVVPKGRELIAEDETSEEVPFPEPPRAPPSPPPGPKPQKPPVSARPTARRVRRPRQSVTPIAESPRSAPPPPQQVARPQPFAVTHGQSVRCRRVVLVIVGLFLILLTCCCGLLLLSSDLSDTGRVPVSLLYRYSRTTLTSGYVLD